MEEKNKTVDLKAYVGLFLLLLGFSVCFGGFMTNINAPSEFQYIGNNYMIIGAVLVIFGFLLLALSGEKRK